MALPTIVFNSSTGSDDNSGAGPGDGTVAGSVLTGTNASFSGGTVTLDGSPDLSGVPTDGSAVLRLVTSTGVQFFKITAVDNGADTVTVTPSPAGTSTGRSWWIGGKRLTLSSASSRLLLDNGGGDGDWRPGWTVKLESGFTDSFSTLWSTRRAGDNTDGPMRIIGVGTRAVLTFNASRMMEVRGAKLHFENIEWNNTNASCDYGVVCVTAEHIRFLNCKFGGTQDVVNDMVYLQTGSAGAMHVESCEVRDAGRYGIHVVADSPGTKIIGNSIHDNVSSGILFSSSNGYGDVMFNNIWNNGGNGVLVEDPGNVYRVTSIVGNTIDDNAGAGIKYNLNGGVSSYNGVLIANNNLTNNGQHAISLITAGGGAATAASLAGMCVRILDNNHYNNSSGFCNATLDSRIESGTTNVDPDYVDAANGDFTPQEATLEGDAYPTSIP